MNSHDSAVKTLLVERSRLQSTLVTNLETHKREYAEARHGYESTKLELLRKLAEESLHASNNNTVESRKLVHEAYGAFANLEKPQDHSNEYEQAIALMEWETRDKVELSINDFERFVRDNWTWSRQFKLALSNYTSSGNSI